ncbi:MAG: type II toxin-antitoxin system PemK/MazF family toxin [Nevskia sp.]|nr:type II toxin-antitoxin system PemK/MazF family toxin [Nevskia sp.]
MIAHQWDVVQASLDPVEGSEQAGIRPVLVISREAVHAPLPVVAVLPLTSHKPGRRVYATEVRLEQGTAGLPASSLVMAHQVRTVSRSRLLKRYGTLRDKALQEQVHQALRVFLDLED